MPVLIRLADVADLGVIREIYNYYVETSTCTFQLDSDSEVDRLSWFQGRSSQHPVVVAVENEEVVGWAAISPWRSRGGYARSVEASVYVRHDRHRRGIGKQLILNLVERARALGYHTMIGGACSEHAASIALQAAIGFQPVAHFREVGYKFGRWLDVIYSQLFLEP